MGMGTIFMLEYLVHLSTLVLIFFIFEGVVRAIAAIAGETFCPAFLCRSWRLCIRSCRRRTTRDL